MKKTLIMTGLILIVALLQARIEVINETPDNLLFQFSLDNYSFQESDGHIYLSAPEIGYIQETGAPMLPEITYYIGVPENGTIDTQIIDIDWKEHRLNKPILPNPRVVMGEKVSEYIYERDEDQYLSRSEDILVIGEPTYYRYNRVIPLTIYPTDYNYNQSILSLGERITFSVRITGDTSQRNNIIDDLDLGANILNYDSARYWQIRDNIELNYAPFGSSDFWYRFDVTQKGMHRLTYQQLSELPLDDIDPRTIRIFTTGGALLPNSVNHTGHPFREIPLLIEGEENGQFEEGDSIIFYAHNRDGFEQNEPLSGLVNHYYNPYSQRTVYWLTFGGNFEDSPKRIEIESYVTPPSAERFSSPTYYHFENESVRRDQSGFTWFSALFSNNVSSNHQYNFQASHVDTSKTQNLTITLQSQSPAQGGSNVTNSISMTINQNLVINRQNWSGITYRTFTRSGYFLEDGTNNVVITTHPTTSSTSIYFDYYRIGYHRFLVKGNEQLLFNINDEDINQNAPVQYNIRGDSQGLKAFQVHNFYQIDLLPVTPAPESNDYDFYIRGDSNEGALYALVRENDYHSISNFREVLPRDLTAENQSIDALIITPDSFSDYAVQLAEQYLTKQGLLAKVVEQQNIFNQFNSGMPDPNAIRLFIRYAFYNYPADAGNTLKHVTLVGSGTIDWRNFSGQANEKNNLMIFQRGSDSSEDFYVDQSGNDLPDLGVGRIPVENIAQCETVWTKISNYRFNQTPGLWRNSLLFVADDEFTTTSTTEIIHSEQVQTIASSMSPGIYTDKLFGIEYSFDSFGNKPGARDDIVAKINDGRLIWCYIGHGAYDLLGHESYFRIADIPLLTNRDKLTLFIAASCSVAQYQFAGFNSLSERLIWHPDGGSIASMAATDVSTPQPNRRLTESFLIRMINQYKLPGIALMEAKQQHNEAQNKRYTFLGDPVLPITTPYRYTNLTIEGDPDSLYAYQRVDVEGSFAAPELTGITDLIAYSSEYNKTYTVQSNQNIFNYTKWGNIYHRGQNEVEQGDYDASFIIPGDILRGDRGRIISYFFDQNSNEDFLDYYYPTLLTNIPYSGTVPDSIPPEITVWLDTENFRNGDIVSPNPTLYARIHDESGINILGEAGHKILLMEEIQTSPIDVTSGFIYDVGSYQTGTLTWPLRDLAEGEHHLQLIVFDNFNNPAVADVHFRVKISEKVVIDRMLPYPNPISDTGYFTFVLNNSAQITISIYTITGRRIRTINATGIQGYNQIYWDGRDQEGARLANNTYIYKIRAREPGNSQATEELGKVIILR